jgi:hypothetical protein
MKKVIKYVIFPGKVVSQHDRDVHFVDAHTLMELYRVDPRECVIYYGDDRDRGKTFKGLITLHPRYDGNYEIPK